MGEMIDIYNEKKEKTGLVLPRKEPLKKGQYMMYVLALVEDYEGRFLITKRALDKKWAAGEWEIPGFSVRRGQLPCSMQRSSRGDRT